MASGSTPFGAARGDYSPVAGRRLLPCPLFFASQGLRIQKAGLGCRSRSPIPPATFVSDDEGKYTPMCAKEERISTTRVSVIHRCAQTFNETGFAPCITRWTECDTRLA